MGLWFTSDQHFGHVNILRYSSRPFADIEEHNEELVRRWNHLVKDDDIVICLGDFSMSIEEAEKYALRLKGKKILIPGNHDRCYPRYYKEGNKGANLSKSCQRYQDMGFYPIAALSDDLKLPDSNVILPSEFGHQRSIVFSSCRRNKAANVVLNHIPYSNEDPRFQKWRPINRGSWLLHGHVHTAWKVDGKQINVGVDNWAYSPVSYEEIMDIILGGESK